MCRAGSESVLLYHTLLCKISVKQFPLWGLVFCSLWLETWTKFTFNYFYPSYCNSVTEHNLLQGLEKIALVIDQQESF